MAGACPDRALCGGGRRSVMPAGAGYVLGVGRRVVGPDGRAWVVRRRWAPRLGPETLLGRFRRFVPGPVRRQRDKLRKNADGIVDVGCLFDELGLVILAIALVLLLVLVVAVVFVIPLVLAVVDVVVVLVVAGAGLVGRVAFRRPWTVEARAGDGTVRTWKVVGWRASRERLDEIAELLAAGISPPA